MTAEFLVRYGTIPEVARFRVATQEPLQRGDSVVVRSHRGVEMGTVLEGLRPGLQSSEGEQATDFEILRPATAEDETRSTQLRADCEREYSEWAGRIREWKLELELIDLEWTVDGEKRILYVLGGRGPDCTKLALQAAAAGFGVIEVQPVTDEGLQTIESPGSGCGCSTGGHCGA